MIQFKVPEGGVTYSSYSWVVHTDGQTQWGYAFPPRTLTSNKTDLPTYTVSRRAGQPPDEDGPSVNGENFVSHLHANGSVSFVNTVQDFLNDCDLIDCGDHYRWFAWVNISPNVQIRVPKYLFGNYQQVFNFYPGVCKGILEGNDVVGAWDSGSTFYGVVNFRVPYVVNAIQYCESEGRETYRIGTISMVGLYGRTIDSNVYVSKVYSKSHVTQSVDPGFLVDSFERSAMLMCKRMDHIPGVDTYSLVQSCYESMNYFSSNGIAYAKDLAEIKNLIPKSGTLLNLSSPKSWAQLFLWAKYGLSLTVKDSQDLVDAFRRFAKSDKALLKRKRQVRYASQTVSAPFESSTAVTRYTVKVDCTPRDVGREILMGELFDTNLSLGNIWDLIPFSFVVDWLYNVSDVLERIDSKVEAYAYYKLNSIVYGTRTSATIDASQIMREVSGSIDLIRYDRFPTSTFPPFRFPVTQSPTIQNHWIEATALIVAATK